MNIRKILTIVLTVTVSFMISCLPGRESFLVSPNVPTPEEVGIDFYFNEVQVSVPEFAQEIGVFGRKLTRQTSYNLAGYADNGIDPASLNDAWRIAYSDVLINLRQAYDIAEELELPNYQAILNILEAYVMMTLVDFFGDVPYSDAIDPDNLNPKLDNGKDVYQAMLNKLDVALTLFSAKSSYPATDLFYPSGSIATKIVNWKRVANSLKLRYYLYLGEVAGINEVLATDTLILSPSQDFQFQYSTNVAAPDSRDQLFVSSYGPQGASGGDFDQSSIFIGTYAVYLLSGEGITEDPRWRYLLYRQASASSALPTDYPCIRVSKPDHFSQNDVWCRYQNFWTRDHGNSDGISPDTEKRTVFGVYPVGGAFDKDALVAANSSGVANLGGAGIFPLLTSSMVALYRAEAALTLQTSDAGNDATLLRKGINDFSSKIVAFGSTIADSSVYRNGYASALTAYINSVISRYNSANNAGKLDIIIKEAYKSSWGNGIEPYNNYRRTGYPANIQPIRGKSPGEFPNSLQYPLNPAIFNINITQKDVASPPHVFWANQSLTLK